eukprot:420146_1
MDLPFVTKKAVTPTRISTSVKYRSQNLVAFLPERFDRYPKITLKLLMEDEFEAEFKHSPANNDQAEFKHVFSASVNSLKNNKLIQQLNKNIKLNTPKNDNNSPPLNMDTNKIPLKLNNNNS